MKVFYCNRPFSVGSVKFLREFFVKFLLVQCDLAVIVDLLQPLVH